MEDTPQTVKDIQMRIWMSKTPAERLIQAVNDNDDLMKFFKEAKQQLDAARTVSTTAQKPTDTGTNVQPD